MLGLCSICWAHTLELNSANETVDSWQNADIKWLEQRYATLLGAGTKC